MTKVYLFIITSGTLLAVVFHMFIQSYLSQAVAKSLEANKTLLECATTTSPRNIHYPIERSFESKGKKIRLESYIPEQYHKGDKFPVVVILHGAGGVGETDGFFRDLANEFVSDGKVAIIVHYMDQSGIKSASYAQMGKNFSWWMETVNTAINHIASDPDFDKNNIKLLGHSLGAQLALHVAATNPKVRSVISLAGCFVFPTKNIKTMPPVLLLQGTKDRTVTLEREKATIAVLKKVNCPYQEQLLKNVDHTFSQVRFDNLIKRINKFLNST